MRKKLLPFIAGVLTTAIVGSLGITALAATGQLSITVDPINIQVNGATFQPKDAQGQDVPMFAYNGTTYAPLRALAEAYGLEVGYDAEENMATVGEGVNTTAIDSTDAVVLDEPPWDLVSAQIYEDAVIFVGGHTYFMCDAIISACEGETIASELLTLFEGATTISYQGKIYVRMHDIQDFLRENTSDSKIDRENKQFHIYF